MASPMCAPRPVPSRRPATSTNATTRRERRRSTRTRVWLKCSFTTRRETPRATRATCPAKRRLARVAIASSRSTRRGTVRAVSNTCPASGFQARTGRRARRVSDCTRRTNDDGENERNCATNMSRAGNRDLGVRVSKPRARSRRVRRDVTARAGDVVSPTTRRRHRNEPRARACFASADVVIFCLASRRPLTGRSKGRRGILTSRPTRRRVLASRRA